MKAAAGQASEVFPTRTIQAKDATLDNTDPGITKQPSKSPKMNEERNEVSVQVQASNNPYDQPFTIEAALSLAIPDNDLRFSLQGYNLYHESTTSK